MDSPATSAASWVVRNHDAWYDAFNVQRADRMYLRRRSECAAAPEERVRIW